MKVWSSSCSWLSWIPTRLVTTDQTTTECLKGDTVAQDRFAVTANKHGDEVTEILTLAVANHTSTLYVK